MARIIVAGVLTGGVIVLVVGDVVDHLDGYRADPIMVGILIGGILALLGLTVSDRLIRG